MEASEGRGDGGCGEELLYGDLDLPEEQLRQNEAEVQLEQARRRLAAMEQQLHAAHAQRDALAAENVRLRSNVSVLYSTALAELKRKDRSISALRDQLAAAAPNKRPSSSSRPGLR